MHIPQPSKGIERTELERMKKSERCLSSAQACHGPELHSIEALDAPSLALLGLNIRDGGGNGLCPVRR